MPSDAQRVQKIKTLVEAGFSHRVMLAHDIHTKHRLVSGQCGLKSCSTVNSVFVCVCVCVCVYAGSLWRSRVRALVGAHSAQDGGERNQ